MRGEVRRGEAILCGHVARVDATVLSWPRGARVCVLVCSCSVACRFQETRPDFSEAIECRARVFSNEWAQDAVVNAEYRYT